MRTGLARAERKIVVGTYFGVSEQSNTLTTDASLTGIGAVLTQQQEGIDRVISYGSKTLNKSQKKLFRN